MVARHYLALAVAVLILLPALVYVAAANLTLPLEIAVLSKCRLVKAGVIPVSIHGSVIDVHVEIYVEEPPVWNQREIQDFVEICIKSLETAETVVNTCGIDYYPSHIVIAALTSLPWQSPGRHTNVGGVDYILIKQMDNFELVKFALWHELGHAVGYGVGDVSEQFAEAFRMLIEDWYDYGGRVTARPITYVEAGYTTHIYNLPVPFTHKYTPVAAVADPVIALAPAFYHLLMREIKFSAASAIIHLYRAKLGNDPLWSIVKYVFDMYGLGEDMLKIVLAKVAAALARTYYMYRGNVPTLHYGIYRIEGEYGILFIFGRADRDLTIDPPIYVAVFDSPDDVGRLTGRFRVVKVSEVKAGTIVAIAYSPIVYGSKVLKITYPGFSPSGYEELTYFSREPPKATNVVVKLEPVTIEQEPPPKVIEKVSKDRDMRKRVQVDEAEKKVEEERNRLSQIVTLGTCGVAAVAAAFLITRTPAPSREYFPPEYVTW